MISGVLDQVADVYTESPSTGKYDVLFISGMPCRLLHVNLQPGATGPDRDELAARRDMMYPADVILPEGCQVEVNSIRWGTVVATFGAPRDWTSVVAYRRCNLIRQQV